MNGSIYRIESLPPPDDIEIIKRIISLIDLTSLNATDSNESVAALVDKVNGFQKKFPDLPNVAGICVYPVFLKLLNANLDIRNVDKIIVAGGFPSSSTILEVKLTEIEYLVQTGANEIDIVFPLHYLFSNKLKDAEEELIKIKSILRNRKLKVILETTYLTHEQIRDVCAVCLSTGVDYIKTSTGKDGSFATLEVMTIICEEIQKHYKSTKQKVGVKPAGGIRTYKNAYQYYTIVEEILGEKWLNKAFFRIGASSLANDLLKHYSEMKKTAFEPYF